MREGTGLLVRNAGYFLAGRHAGLLPYFPFALLAVALSVTGPRDRSRWLLLAAVVAIALLDLLLDPHGWPGGAGALGNARFAAVYPALLFLPGRLALRRSLVLPYAAAGLWTAAALVRALVPAALPSNLADLPAFRVLPAELTLLGGGIQLPGYGFRNWGQGIWVMPLSTFQTKELHPNGVWVQGASTSEVLVVSPEPLRELRFSAHSLTADNEIVVDSGADRVLVRFDTPGKRAGTPINLAVEPVAADLGLLPSGEWIYRFTLTVSDGIIPARRFTGSQDSRYLGVFLDFTGRGL